MLLFLFLFLRDMRGRLIILVRLKCVTVKQFESEEGRARHHTQRRWTVTLEKSQYQRNSRNGFEWYHNIKLDQDALKSPSVLGVMHA